MELQAFLQGLEVARIDNLNIIEVETDETEVIMQLNHPSPLFVNIVNDCRFVLKKMGNPQIRIIFEKEM